jgi:hypothetical protein
MVTQSSKRWLVERKTVDVDVGRRGRSTSLACWRDLIVLFDISVDL